MDLFERRQYEEAAADDDAAATRSAIEADRIDLHTSGPGIVQMFDAAKQTAVVQPVVQKFFRGKGFKALPELMDVPVQFPRGGGFVLTFPVAKGDECLLVFSERAIDTWHASGGVQAPHEFRTHDLSDACAVMGISSIPHAVPDFNANAVELRSLDGSAKLQIDAGKNIKATSATGNIEVSAGSGKVTLNVPGGASAAVQMVTGVLTGIDPCPILGMTHGSVGGGCARTHAGKA